LGDEGAAAAAADLVLFALKAVADIVVVVVAVVADLRASPGTDLEADCCTGGLLVLLVLLLLGDICDGCSFVAAPAPPLVPAPVPPTWAFLGTIMAGSADCTDRLPLILAPAPAIPMTSPSSCSGTCKNLAKARANLSRSSWVGASMSSDE